MMPDRDPTAPPRAGEELDLRRLEAWLEQGPVACEQFPSGHSNLTYLVRIAGRELVLRRPPFGTQVKSAHDMAREYRVLSQLHRVYPLAPQPTVPYSPRRWLSASNRTERFFRLRLAFGR